MQNGDRIRLECRKRELDLLVSEAELARRSGRTRSRRRAPSRGYRKLFLEPVTQADQGCDFDFLRPQNFVEKIPRPR